LLNRYTAQKLYQGFESLPHRHSPVSFPATLQQTRLSVWILLRERAHLASHRHVVEELHVRIHPDSRDKGPVELV
jgi:hypothetical protein